MPFIDPQKLAAEQLASRDDLSILDVRSPEEYAEGHIEGAVNIPLAELEARVGELPSGAEVVTYRNMYHPGSSRGEGAADMLTKLGLDAKAMQGGFPGWRDAGLPVEATDEPTKDA